MALKQMGALLFLLITVSFQAIQAAPFSAYLVAFFTSPDPSLPFNNIAINNITGDIYIGAREMLYQLSSDLTLKHMVNTGSCLAPNEENINYNKLLLVAPSAEDKLITCGSCDGHCEIRSAINISHDVLHRTKEERDIVVANKNIPTVGAIVLGANYSDDGKGTLDEGFYMFTGVTGNDIQFISKHNLDDLERIQSIPQQSNTMRNSFRHLISYMDYLYYFMSRENMPGTKNSVHLGRLCRNSLDNKFDSYTEIELQCGSNSDIQSAHIGPAGSQLADSLNINSSDAILYTIFTDGISSALCVYKMSDVQQSFEDAVLRCIQYEYDVNNKDDKEPINDYLDGSSCRDTSSPLNDSVQCTAYYDQDGITGTYYKYASGTDPLSASPIIIIPDVIPTSIVTTTERHHTVAFVGDTQGNLHKLNLVNSTFGYVYENISLGGGSVLQEMFLDEPKEQITLATSSDEGSMVLTLDLVNCNVYQTCEECIGENGGSDGDPYCGWCTLEARCTRYEECPFRNESTRWLSYNALQCVSMSDVEPDYRLPYQVTEQEITITVQQLPDLKDSYQYQCAFDLDVVNANTVGNTVTCVTPPSNELPTIPAEEDHVMMLLSIVSTETDIAFISTDFILFNCSYLTSCSSCVSSPWPCDWCVYDNRCTHENSSCQSGDTVVIGENNQLGSVNKGMEFCPQLLGTSEPFLIPVNIDSGYSLLARNLPTDMSKVQPFECILLIDGVEMRVGSTFFNETYILCSDREYMYNENVLEKNVSVSVQWNGQYNIDDPADTYVTLYKCSVNNGSCSRCLSPEATPPILNCGWCGDDCNVLKSDVCQRSTFIRQNETQLCSAPVITDFYPLSGPINGHTRLELQGTDLGVEFDDVLQILIGDLTCNLTDMESFYQPGQSVSCITKISTNPTSGRIEITVRSGEGNNTGQSSEDFQYRNPVISGFSPTDGQAAGGTDITITGMNLNTGRNIGARFGEAICNELNAQDTIATCITSSIPMNQRASFPLTMTFDGVDKTFEDYTFTYMPNPIINEIDRTASFMSGGLDIRVTGEQFDLIQEARIVVSSLTTNATNSELCNGTNTLLICPTPSFPDNVISNRRKRATDGALSANLTFDFDGYIVDGGIIEYFLDPTYDSFSGPNRIYESGNQRLEIRGMNLDLASTEDDVQILVGPNGACEVDDLEIDLLRCQLPDTQPQAGNINGTIEQGPTQDLPAVTVLHGNLMFYPGYVRYSTTPPVGAIVGGVLGAAVVILVILSIIGLVFYRRSHEQLNKQAQEFEMLEKKIQHRVETAFHELQADMSEVEDQVSHLGVPFVNALDYSKDMLFAGLPIIPPNTDPEYMNTDLETALIKFSTKLSDAGFLTDYIEMLEERRKAHRRDRVNIASLITVILMTEGKFEYLTETLFKLLEKSIEEAADSGRAKSLFRRTETIVEKLLSNWITLCMYQYLKKHAAKPLYLLYQTIKIQVEKGPIDITTGQSVFSLNFECLLEEEVEFEELSLSVVGGNKQHLYYVKVLDVDCITQVKQKILDAAYRKSHIVQQNRAHEMDLLWYHPGGEERVLKDQDEFNRTVGNTQDVFINTVKTYGVADGSQVALIAKASLNETGVYQPVVPGAHLFHAYQEDTGPEDVRERDYTRIRTLQSGGSKLIHLVLDDEIEPRVRGKSLTKLDREFLAPRLLVTKKTIQPRLDEFLEGVFKQPDQTPCLIKHLFSFFDKMADKYCTEKSEQIAEAWKSNSLPLHYWMTVLTHPSYVFDMRQSRSADQSVSVLANMLDNACKKVRSETTQTSALNRVLFFKDLPDHIQTISEYYSSVKDLQAPTQDELQDNFQKITQDFTGLFSRPATLEKLYDFTAHDTDSLLDSVKELMPN